MGESRILVGPECPEDILQFIALSASPSSMIEIDHRALEKLDEAREVYMKEAKTRKVYGFCTGLGEIYNHEGTCGSEWEKTILEEHATQVGRLAPIGLVRAFLTVRLLQLARGTAPVRGVVAQRIVDALNSGIIPVVPLYGSVGASGDLAPSAHAFRCILYGEGEAYYHGEKVACIEALRREGLGVLPLEPGEALALINNTAWSTAITGLGLWLFTRILEESLSTVKESLSLARCQKEHYSSEIAELRPSQGLKTTLRVLEQASCEGGRLQDPYSLRCTPIIYGAVLDALKHTIDLVNREACSSTENPAIINGRVIHWCGFHSVQVSLAADYARILASHIANIMERRIAQLMRSEITGLPPFMAGPTSSVGAMMAHYTSASLAAMIRQHASPAGVHSIPTSGLQEDVVPQSPNGAILLARSVVHLARILSIERAVIRYAKGGSRTLSVGRLVDEEYEELRGDPVFGSILKILEDL